MELGIAGRTAIVCASSRGLGRACAAALVSEGVNVIVNGRDEERLALARDELRALGAGTVDAVAADVTTAEGREELLRACPAPDILVNNNAGPSPAEFMGLSPGDWEAALAANMVAPLTLIAAVLPAMRERRFGRIVNITSAMVTAPRSPMALSSGARAGLTAVVKAVAREVAADNVTINNLLPERFDTDRQAFMARRAVEREGISMEEARRRQAASLPVKRLGRPSELGATCAFVCSAHAGFMTGMNIHLDGGAYPGLV